MLVRFTSKASAGVSMFEQDASRMLRLMGHSGTIPSAIRADDVAARLAELEETLQRVAAEERAAQHLPDTHDDDDEEAPIPVNRRAYPLLELLRAAVKEGETVMWDYEHSIL